MAASRNVIFSPNEIIRACEEALRKEGVGLVNGPPASPAVTLKALGEVFKIAKTGRDGPNGVKYLDVSATVEGKSGRLLIRFSDEKHVGIIAPFLDADVVKANAELKNKEYGVIKKRDRAPTINIQQYPERIEVDASGNPKGPLPTAMSPYHRCIRYLHDYFKAEMERRLATGEIAKRKVGVVYADSTVFASNDKVCDLVQTHVSFTNAKSGGQALLNPITRMTIPFDKDTGLLSQCQVFDRSKASINPTTGKQDFEPLRFDGLDVTANNVHGIKSHSIVSGIVSVDAVCFSNMGISIPPKVKILIVQNPVYNSIGLEDVFDDADGPAAPAAPALASSAAPAPAASTTPTSAASAAPAGDAGAAPALSENDLSAVISDMTV